ncbi:aminopeptidase N [Paeniglutamicibacter cryotolerans]|uniref:Aminopeptidase N n=1 Tax=Paeniglutamicibacter cryotolerans TaxID=670079 RepID=A0A839QUG8_9MICC|nr:aminopeptidase N [Paeniglutamicibacter cryotolerans]MBB2996922.1 aminopeptidase N [Paeniglutamicibacter cryotolerans]
MPGLNLTREEARTRAELIAVQSYGIALDLTRGEKVFGSHTTVAFTAVPGSSTFIDAITDTVHSITLNGSALDPSLISDGVRIELADLAAENVLVIDADAPYMNTGEGLHRFVDPVDNEVYLYSQFEVPDSRRMFAVFEQPDLKAQFSFTVTAPAHWDVISNSPTPEPVPAAEGTAIWAFTPTARISSYITALIAGPYESVRSELTSSNGNVVPLGVFARKSLIEHLDAENIFTLTRQGFEFFEEQFGTPYPFEKYDQLFVPEFNAGAMENAGAVTFLETYVFRSRPTNAAVERRAITILHELAHMWFGDLVTMRWWNDLWLNESFAEFMSTLAAAENTEFTQSWTTFNIMEKNWAYRQDQLPSTHPIKAEINDLEDVQVNFDGITYAKGASVLRQLVAWVGQEEFMAGVRGYFAKHAWSNTELPDLMRELEASSGRDLTDWTALWLETAGVNKLTPIIEMNEDGTIASFVIAQSAPSDYPTIRPHRLAVGCYDLDDAGKLVRVHREELDVAGTATAVESLTGRKRPALILINDDDLAYAKIRLDDVSLATAQAHLKDFDASLPRTLVWGAAWDAVRDAETAGRNYVELVLNNIAHESDSSVVMVLLRQLHTTLDYYIAAEDTRAASLAAADSLWQLSIAAQAGSDSQLQFVKAFAVRAESAAQLDAISALFDGSVPLEGLAVDTDLRWELLTSLVAGGRLGREAIDAELAGDNTGNGQLAAELAKAAIPTPEAKRATWEAVMVQGSLSNLQQRAAIAGFSRVHDAALIAPYVSEYFASAQSIWDAKSHEIAQQIIVGLYPAEQISPATLEATDAFLDSLGTDSPALRRLVVESRDAVLRALAAQEADRA